MVIIIPHQFIKLFDVEMAGQAIVIDTIEYLKTFGRFAQSIIFQIIYKNLFYRLFYLFHTSIIQLLHTEKPKLII